MIYLTKVFEIDLELDPGKTSMNLEFFNDNPLKFSNDTREYDISDVKYFHSPKYSNYFLVLHVVIQYTRQSIILYK